MALRTGHGNGKGVPRIEVLPLDELPEIAPAQTDQIRRNPNGTFADARSAGLAGSKGGYAKTARARLASALGLAQLVESDAFYAYRLLGDEFVKHHLANLAAQCGGELGPAPSSIVVSAALQLSASRFLFDQASKSGDPKIFHQASVLSNDSRQNLLAAYELGRREAEARALARGPVDPLAQFLLPEPDDKSSK